jgi:hypothetical protein
LNSNGDGHNFVLEFALFLSFGGLIFKQVDELALRTRAKKGKERKERKNEPSSAIRRRIYLDLLVKR